METCQLGMVTSFTKIAVKVLLRMKLLGLMQKALAERMNCTQQYISKILKGKENMSLDTLSKLAKTYNILRMTVQIPHQSSRIWRHVFRHHAYWQILIFLIKNQGDT